MRSTACLAYLFGPLTSAAVAPIVLGSFLLAGCQPTLSDEAAAPAAMALHRDNGLLGHHPSANRLRGGAPAADERSGERAFEIFSGPMVRMDPLAGNLSSDCIDQGGEGFPANTEVTLMFEDINAGLIGPSTETTDAMGNFEHHFGLGCAGTDAAKALMLAKQYLDRVDPRRVGFRDRPMRYWAEYFDSGSAKSSTIDYTLSG